ncbi:MAG: DUF4374 domain-containing protein [Rikenellaceae bacterium]|nr:DUF4374 domain-containing protein [Rikenellaceae bacterium]
MNKNYLSKGFLALSAAALLAGCDDDNGVKEPGTGFSGSAYVISATVTSGESSSNYLVMTDDLSQGSISTVSNGRETDTGTYWVYYGDKYLYRLVYNQGSAGVTTSYELNGEGTTSPRSNTYEVKRFTSYGFYDRYLITTSTGALDESLADPQTGYIPRGFLINYIDAENQTATSNTAVIWSEDYLGNGEYVTFAGLEQVGSRLFTAPVPMGMSQYGVVTYPDKVVYEELVKKESGGTNSSQYSEGEIQWTQHPDEAWIAIYPDMDFDDDSAIKIKTEKISYAAGRNASQYYQMVWAADNGDVYVFSPSYAKSMTESVQQTTLPAGVVRIKNGEDDFDDSYYVNIEEQSGGCGFLRSWHVTEDYFMLLMYDAPFGQSPTANRLAIFKGESGVLTYVTGLPAASAITKIGTMPYFGDGKAYIPLLVENEDPAVYIIDAATAAAVKGVSVQATEITSVGVLTYYE